MDATNSITHLKVAARPEHQGVFWNELQLLQPLKFRLELNVHNGYWFDTANQSSANCAARLNTLLNYQVTTKTDLYVRVENINNERTPEITSDFNFNGTAVYFGISSLF
jgi:outer membrane cobalamin receptor